MAAHAPMARVPFAPLDNSRLQHLASAKNRQNGLAAQCSTFNGKSTTSISKNVFSRAKRPFEPAIFEDFNSENVDPAVLFSPSKKSKSDGLNKPIKPFTFSLSPTKSMLPPPTIPSRLTTPARDTMSSPRAPLTAPAGRSPKRKCAGLAKTRRISAPFSRIDPPLSSRNDSGLPFSLDAAISGTFAKAAPKDDAGATIQESMPKNWFFDIYEDTPEEEASNLMEHSTLTLDLSSDEESSKPAKDDKGKENMPPEDYDAPAASRTSNERTAAAPVRVKKTDIIRRKVESDKMDDGERSALSDLETEDFIPDGLDKDAKVIIDALPEKAPSTSTKVDLNNLFATAVPFTASSTKRASGCSSSSHSLYDLPVVDSDGDVKGDIIVWEDSVEAISSSSPTKEVKYNELEANDSEIDENRVPVDEKVL